uniref:Methyltransf_FA domain-containing protein n=1 Tax=Caenorhabditis tropicalis TaxID=1561998 RepID=A0A1I7TU29_9PELO
MGSRAKRQGVISGSITWNGNEYVEIFDQNFKYLYGEVDDLFIAYGSWVEYDVVDAPEYHPKNCLKRAINIDMDFKVSKAPTTDEFGDKPMNVRDFNKVDYFQFDSQGDGNLTHKSTIRRNFSNDMYYNSYYGEVSISRDAKNRLIEFDINELDVMMSFISSERYCGTGPHWEVTHFVHQGTPYSINGFLSIRGFIVRGPGGIVRNRRDVRIPPDALRPKHQRQSGRPQWGEPIRTMSAPTEKDAPIEKPHGGDKIQTPFKMKPENSDPFATIESRNYLQQKLESISISQRSAETPSMKPRGFEVVPEKDPESKPWRALPGLKPSESSTKLKEPMYKKATGFPITPLQIVSANRPVKLKTVVQEAPRFTTRSFGGIPLSPVTTVEEPPKPAGESKSKEKEPKKRFRFGVQKTAPSPLPPPPPPPPAPVNKPASESASVSRGFRIENITKEEKKHPLDDSFEMKKTKESNEGNLYDDNWGDETPFIQPPQRDIGRPRFPPQTKVGLSKYGQSHF